MLARSFVSCFFFLCDLGCSISSGTAPFGGGLLSNLGEGGPSRNCFWQPFETNGSEGLSRLEVATLILVGMLQELKVESRVPVSSDEDET